MRNRDARRSLPGFGDVSPAGADVGPLRQFSSPARVDAGRLEPYTTSTLSSQNLENSTCSKPHLSGIAPPYDLRPILRIAA